QVAETTLLTPVLLARRLQFLLENRGLLPRLDFFTLEPFDLRFDTGDGFRSARNLISNPRLAAHSFKLLLAQTVDCAVLRAASLRQIAGGRHIPSRVELDEIFFRIDLCELNGFYFALLRIFAGLFDGLPSAGNERALSLFKR